MIELSGAWNGWKFVKRSGEMVLVSPSGRSYKPSDIEPDKYTQSDLAKALGITRGAIADRIRRGTLPPFDEGKTWRIETVKHLLE